MKPPRLSICIATLNRATFLSATLESILAQANDEIEIVIVDGASTDHTSDVVRHAQEKFPHVRYERLPVKGGVDQDYSRAVELARGEYCWLMTDDDLLKPGALVAVLNATQRGYGLIIVNAEVRDASLSQLLAASRLPFAENRIYRPSSSEHQRLLVEVADYLSFIGGVVIQRQLWNTRDKASYYGSEFVHMGVIFQNHLPSETFVLATPWITIRYGNAQWTSRSFEVWMFKWPKLIWSFSNFPDTLKRRISPPEPWRRAWALFLFRARGAYSLAEYHRWVEPRLSSAAGKWLARLIARLPGCATNLLASLYARLRQLHMLQIDLMNSPFYYGNCLKHK